MSDLIDRQQAIKEAESWVGLNWYEQHLQRNVVEWLKELPSALGTNLAEVGTDAISRDAVKELLNNNGLPHHINPILWKELNDLPSAQPKRGRWERGFDGNHAVCSNCQAWWIPFGEGYKTDYHFCPNCGADMRGEQDE